MAPNPETHRDGRLTSACVSGMYWKRYMADPRGLLLVRAAFCVSRTLTNKPETHMSEKPQVKTCYYCKKSISYRAIKCPECHTDLRSWFMRHKIMTTLLIIFVVIPVTVMALSSMITTNSKTSTESVIGKDAYNSSNDVRIGKIIDEVDCTNIPNARCYKIDQGADYSRPAEMAVSAVTVK